MLDYNTMFWFTINLVNNSLYLIFFKIILDYSNKKITSKTISYISLIGIFILNYFIFKNNVLISVILYCFYYKLNYNSSWLKGITYSSIYCIIVSNVIESISSNLIFSINYLNLFKEEVINPDIVIVEGVIFKLILLIISLMIYIYITKLYKSKRLIDILIFIPIITNTLCLLYIFRYIAANEMFINISVFDIIIMPILILISNVCFFIFIIKIIQSYNIKRENKILNENIIKEYNHYLIVNKENERVKEMYHDIKNHMICIRDLCESNDVEKVLNYIDGIELRLKKYGVSKQNFSTGNMIVDSILKNKKIECEEKSIDFKFNVNFSKNEFMEMIDICTIFSNIIDNSIEACDKINLPDLEKKIKLESKYIDGFCIIVIENTKINKLKIKGNNFFTDKLDISMHGIGLKNIKNTVEKYFGEVVIEHSENKFTLKIMIPLNYN